jgi:hypothetical protein
MQTGALCTGSACSVYVAIECVAKGQQPCVQDPATNNVRSGWVGRQAVATGGWERGRQPRRSRSKPCCPTHPPLNPCLQVGSNNRGKDK